MSNLAKKLQQYYTKKGNRIVFSNGMTLNQLALEMWERLDYQGIDVSVLSRVISGQRIFTLPQLKKFCSILKLKKSEKDELYFAVEEDYLRRCGLSIFPSRKTSINIIDIFSSQLEKINYIRDRGLLQAAMDWADELLHLLHIYNNDEKNPVFRRKILEISGNTLFQKGWASGDILCPKENMRVISSIINKQSITAKELNSPCLTAKTYVIEAFAYYLLGRYSHRNQYSRFYRKSLSITQKALVIPKTSDQIKLFFWRYAALNSIYLLDGDGFKKAAEEMRKIIQRHTDKTDFSFIFWALDTIARGQAYFDRSKALTTVYESRIFSQKLQLPNSLREAGSIRTELEILKQLKSKAIIHTQKQAEKGLQIARECGFHRYKKYFLNHLNNLSL